MRASQSATRPQCQKFDSKRGLKYDSIKHIAWALHDIIYNDGHYDFCDVDATGVRTGDPQVFLDKLREKKVSGFSGHRQFQPIGVVGGEVLTMPPTFMLADWRPGYARLNGKYATTKTIDMHVNRFSLESAPTSEKVLHRDFYTGIAVGPAKDIKWMTNVTKSPKNWYHDMCGKSHRINMDRTDKFCDPCPPGEFNAPLDGEDLCESISDFACPAGTYLVEALAAGAGLSTLCMPCGVGMFAASGSKRCDLCPRGSFQAETGSSACASCGAGLTTEYPGAETEVQ